MAEKARETAPARLYVESVRVLKLVAESRGVTVADVVDELVTPLAQSELPGVIQELEELRKRYKR